MKLSVRTMTLLASIGLGSGLIANVAAAQSAPHPIAPPAGATNAPGRSAPCAEREDHGIFSAIGEALGASDLTQEQQKAVGKLAQELGPRQAEVEQDRKKLMSAIADQLAAEHFDRSALDEPGDTLVTAHQAELPVLRKTFMAIHDLLTPEQRGKFADTLQKHLDERKEHHAAGAWFNKFAKDLALSDDQKEQVHEVLENAKKTRGSETGHAAIAEKMLQAFRGDSFNPEAVAPEKEAQAHVKDHVTRMLDVSESIAGILTPEQRTKAAEKIREHLNSKACGSEPTSPGTAAPGAAPSGEAAPSRAAPPERTRSEDVQPSRRSTEPRCNGLGRHPSLGRRRRPRLWLGRRIWSRLWLGRRLGGWGGFGWGGGFGGWGGRGWGGWGW